MSNIILTKTLSVNGFTINTTDVNKTNYPLTAEVRVNNVLLGSGPVDTFLPFALNLTGLNEIELTLYSANSSMKNKLCHLHDDILYCNIIQRLAKLDKKDLITDETPILYWLLLNTIEDDGCECSCANLKTIYANLLEIINPDECC